MEAFSDLDKKYYRISEVASLTGLPISTLRFWEKKFTIIKPKRNEKGTRYYTPKDVEELRMVAYLVKEHGLRLEAAEEQLRTNRNGVSRKAKAVERLRSIRATLQQMLDATNTLR